MSANEAIRFRYLTNQLSKQEKQSLIFQLLNKPHDIITKALFQFFINNQTEAQNVNSLISKIIRKREKVQVDPPQFKLDMIPKALIGHIASFTNQSDYANLSNTNRSVYLGCNTPNMLQTLHLHKDYQYSSIKLESYPSIKYFEFGLKHFHKFRISSTTQPLFNQLNELSISGKHADVQAFNQFVENNFVNSSNVKALSCIDFGRNIDKDPFTKFVSKLSKLTFLHLNKFSCDIDVGAVHKALPNLRD